MKLKGQSGLILPLVGVVIFIVVALSLAPTIGSVTNGATNQVNGGSINVSNVTGATASLANLTPLLYIVFIILAILGFVVARR